MRYGVIEQMRQQYPVPPMCRFLGVSTSGYYAWRKRPPSMRAQQEPRYEAQVRAAHERTRETFGPERLQKELADRGVQIGVHRIKRLRTKLGLRCKQKRKFKATTNSTHTCQSHRIYWTKILVRVNRTRRGAATSPILRPMRDGFTWLASRICLAGS